MKRFLGRFVVIGLLVVTGIWLSARGVAPAPESSARLAALRGLAAPGRPTAPGSDAPVPTGGTVNPAAQVNMTDVPAGIDPDSTLYAQWQRGEVDIYENESILPAAEIARLQEDALNLPAAGRLLDSPSGPGALGPTPGTQFESLQYAGWVPPDPELAVGPNHIIAVVNASFAIYNKSGGTLVAPTTFVNFFNPICTGTLFDPNVVYDEAANRYIMAVDDDGVNYCAAVSQTANPTGAWWVYVFPTGNANDFFDYPHAGIGLNHLFIGANMFRGGFLESRIYAMDKWAMYAGGGATWAMKPLPTSQDTPQPMHFHGWNQGTWPTSANHYFFTNHNYNGDTYSVWRWINPLSGGNPTLLNTVNLQTFTGVTSGYPVNVPQSGSGALLQANDFRPHDFEYRNGFAWSAQTISCNPGTGTVDCVRWAKINPVTGTIADAGVYASDGVYRTFPNLAVNKCGDMAIGYTRSSTTTFPSIYVNGRENSDPAGTLEAEVLQKAGTIAYTAFDGSPHRWGDYTGMTIDPDGLRFWYLGEYSKNTGDPNGRWGTHIRSYTYPSCGSGGGGGPEGFVFSTAKAGNFGGVAFAPSDIVRYVLATGDVFMRFDASDVGITKNLTAFYRQHMPAGTLNNFYLVFAANVTLPGVGVVTPFDVVKFTPTSLGSNTAGTFSWYFDGSDVGLSAASEKIDALSLDNSGRLMISTTGGSSVPGLNFADEDVVAFTPSSTGVNTAGTWSMSFDGSAAVANLGIEDVNGFWDDPSNDNLYITILGAFNLGGVAGDGKDIVKLTPAGGGTYTPSIFWDGSAAALPATLDAVDIDVPEP